MRRIRRMRTTTAAMGGGVVLALGLGQAAHADGDTFLVDTTADTVDADIGDGKCADANGDCSLRAAVQEANADDDETTIVLGGLTYTLTIANSGGDEEGSASGDLDVTSDIELEGEDSTVDANGIDRAFEVFAGASLHVDDLAVTGGLVGGGTDAITGSGGAFSNAGTLRIERSRLFGNEADGPMASGGAILNTGDLHVSRSELENNSATRAGGAIEANAGRTVVERSEMSGNRTGPTPGNGGALHLTGAGFVSVERTVVSGNTASDEGGGLWNSASGEMVVSRSTIVGNTASGDDADQGGGGLFNDGGTLTVTRSEIEGNIANGTSGSGGGILNNMGVLDVSRTTIEDNTAVRAGGGIEANAGTTRLDRVVLDDNSTGPNPGNGGGLHLTGAGRVDIDDSTVTGNSAAAEGGGLWNSATGTMIVTDTRVAGNTAPLGPNVFNDGGTFVLNGTPVPNSNVPS